MLGDRMSRSVVFVALVVLTGSAAGAASPTSPGVNGQLVFSGTSDGRIWHIFRIEADGSGQQQLTNAPWFDWDPAVSADGARIAFSRLYSHGRVTSKKKAAIFVMNADGSELTRLTSKRFLDFEPVWSPDGEWIAFKRTYRGLVNAELFVIAADGSAMRRLTNYPMVDSGPSWSPDGSRLVYQRNRRGGNFEIRVVGADGEGDAVLTSTLSDEAPAWSPDGARIAFTSYREEDDLDVWVMNADGTGQRALTDNGNWEWTPRWSPDGSRIVFERDYGFDNPEIAVVDAATGAEVRLTDNKEWDDDPTWSPDGTKIAVRRGGDIFLLDASGAGETQLTDTPGLLEGPLEWAVLPAVG